MGIDYYGKVCLSLLVSTVLRKLKLIYWRHGQSGKDGRNSFSLEFYDVFESDSIIFSVTGVAMINRAMPFACGALAHV